MSTPGVTLAMPTWELLNGTIGSLFVSFRWAEKRSSFTRLLVAIVTSFATRFAPYDGKNPVTIFGTEGTLKVPDPNGFDGPVFIRKNADADWTEVAPLFVKGYGRSVGLADMAYAIRSGRELRAGGQQAMAVLDLMQGFLDSSAKGKAFVPTVTYTKPAAMPAHLPFGTLDE